MKQETKDTIVVVGSTMLTLGTSLLVETAVGYGTVAVLNHVMEGAWTKGQVRMFQGIVGLGSIGVAGLVAYETFPKFNGIMNDIVSMFPTDPKEVTDAE